MSAFVIFKRWALREGREESELVGLVREEIAPHFSKLPGCLKLELLRIVGTRSYLALQYWQCRERWREATESDYYRTWYREYVPILKRWDELMVFEQEWDTEDVLETE